MATSQGRWHGPRRYFGLHYDLHAGTGDTDLGVRANPKYLVPMLELLGADFVQTDCKGHPGYTSWFSKVPDASVSPGVRKDAMKGWRAATAQLGLPLHCHYSGIWDDAAGARHPEWCRVDAEGKPVAGRMCPRGGYQEQLMVPQFMELIDRYGVDGFWVDGEIWATEPCYCPRCREAFTAQTGIAAPPTDPQEADWPAWFAFTMRSFEEHVARYCAAVHAHKPGVLVCSNWLQTFRHPGEPWVPTDWISGDNTWVFGLDGCRCEARFISTRGKPWDIMIWSFYAAHGMGRPDSPWTAKPAAMIQQEAAVVLAFGGNVQVYENPGELRNGQLVPWRIARLREVGRFVKARRTICQGTTSLPQVAVLHSEHHARSRAARNLMWGIDTAAVQGAVYSLLENHWGVDVLDEWALGPRLDEFPVVVAPEQGRMSDGMVEHLKAYVAAGGHLLVSGPDGLERFGSTYLGVRCEKTEAKKTYHVPAADGSVPVFQDDWQLIRPTRARGLGRLAASPLLDERLLPYAAATVRQIGKGTVAYIPFQVFAYFDLNRYPLVRAFVGQVMQELAGPQPVRVQAPACVDVVLRQKGERRLVHLINRASGIPNRPNDGTVDQIPCVGPLQVEMALDDRPGKVSLALEQGALQWDYRTAASSPRARPSSKAAQPGWLVATVEQVHIHAVLVVEP